MASTHSACQDFELRFRSLFVEGRGLSFPCDRQGNVNLDDLTESARANFLLARSRVGRDLAFPAVQPLSLH